MMSWLKVMTAPNGLTPTRRSKVKKDQTQRKTTVNNRLRLSLSLSILFFLPEQGMADTREEQLFIKCYSQFTQSFPGNQHPRRLEVARGDQDAVSACMQILRSIDLSQTPLSVQADADQLAALQTFHQLHHHLFLDKTFTAIGDNLRLTATRALIDPATPSFYWTYSLFSPTVAASQIVQLAQTPLAVRSLSQPNVGHFRFRGEDVSNSDFIFGNSTPFPDRGRLLGFRLADATRLNYTYLKTRDNETERGQVEVLKHLGAGVIGSTPYFLRTVDENQNFKADGALKMPRKWGRALFHDLFCRELPVIRSEDAQPFVEEGSDIAFRQSSGCVGCHASMDRVAAGIRNFRYLGLGNGNTEPSLGGYYIDLYQTDKTSEPAWPTSADRDYHRRPNKGVFMMRTHDGQLIEQNFSTLAELGQIIANTEDFYICQASRYYAYLMGVEVELRDWQASNAPSLSTEDQKHLNQVIRLGKGLREHQDLVQLLEDILQLPDYGKELKGPGGM